MPPDELDSLFPDLQGLMSADWGNSPGSTLTRDPEHGGVSAESLDVWLRENAGRPLVGGVPTSGGGTTTPQAPVASDPSSPGEGDDEELEEEEEGHPEAPPQPSPAPPPEPPEAPPEAPDVVSIGGRQFTRAQLEAFARFSSDLETDPRLQQLLTQHYTGQAQPAYAPAPAPTLPPVAPAYLPAPEAPPLTQPFAYTEDDDPRFVQLMRVVQEQQAQIANLAQITESTAQANIARSNADMQALVDRAAESFRDQHNLSDEEIMRLRRTRIASRAVDELMHGWDPVTNTPTRPNVLEATDRALEIAYYADPQLRQRMIDDAISAQRERNRHRQKLAGVGGSSGSVSRTPQEAPRPGTQASRNSMLEEVGQMLSGTWSEPGR